jgi:uncharacterized protein YdeI (YjbR/CyaY-like superfamily)
MEVRSTLKPRMRAEWRAWLAAHHDTAEEIWLIADDRPEEPTVPYLDAVEEALCFGWIDSRPRKLDAARTMLLISPRKTGSAWSQLNRQRIEALTAAGLMQANGLQRVAEAKQDGTWSKLETIDDLVLPSDLVTALEAQEGARANWDGFPKSARRGILEWIIQAKLPKTRAARIKITAAEAARNKRANQWRGTPQST